MFSMEEKRRIAAAIEQVLLEINHPEMPKERPSFKLHVDGAEAWSWADIEPNWKFDDQNPAKTTVWNESAREVLKKSDIQKLRDVLADAAPKYPYEPEFKLPDAKGVFIGRMPTRGPDVEIPVYDKDVKEEGWAPGESQP